MTKEEFIVHRSTTHGEPIELYLKANPDLDKKLIEYFKRQHNQTGKVGYHG
jgi:hypothetical protein